MRLGERADDHVRTYSLWMRQRLGIAAALLKDPALVVLALYGALAWERPCSRSATAT